MKAQAFLTLVGQMMTAQQDYFKTRKQTALIAAKNLEREVRDVIKEGKLEPDDLPPAAQRLSEDEYKEYMRLVNAHQIELQLDLPGNQRPTDQQGDQCDETKNG